MLSDERLAEIEALARAATPGPYRACSCGKCGMVWSTAADVVVYNVAGENEDVPGVDPEQRNKNALYAGSVSPDVTLDVLHELLALRRLASAAERVVRLRGWDEIAERTPPVLGEAEREMVMAVREWRG